MQPPAQSVPLPAPPHAVDWRLGLSAAAVGGLAAGLASALPRVGVGCGLWMLAGGALAVSFYQRRRPLQVITRGAGARIGALTGVVAYFVYAAFTVVQVTVFHQGGRLREQLRQSMEQSAGSNPDPQVQAMVQWMMTPAGVATFVTVSMLLMFIGFVLFCTAGGALGASLFGKRDHD